MKTILKGKNVLVTGAAHGIGRALTNFLVKEGCRLCLVDIDRPGLMKVSDLAKEKGLEPILMIKDLAQPNDRQSLISLLDEKGFYVDILINNVGVGFWRYFQDTPWEKLGQIIEINIKCMTHLTKLVLPGMLVRNEGYIVNLSSTASFIGAPNAACYSATKAYISIFSETLNMELKKTGVKVICVFPGATDTPFWKYAMMDNSKYGRDIRRMTAEKVAEETVAAIRAGKAIIIPGARNRLNMVIVKFLPRKLLKKIALNRFNGINIKK